MGTLKRAVAGVLRSTALAAVEFADRLDPQPKSRVVLYTNDTSGRMSNTAIPNSFYTNWSGR